MTDGVKITVYSKKGNRAMDKFFLFDELDRMIAPKEIIMNEIIKMRDFITTLPDKPSEELNLNFQTHPTP